MFSVHDSAQNLGLFGRSRTTDGKQVFSVIARFRPQNRALRSNPQKTSIPTSQRSHFVRLCYSAGRFVTSGHFGPSEGRRAGFMSRRSPTAENPKPAGARLTGFYGHPRRFVPNAAFASRVAATDRLARVECRAGDP